MKPSVFVCPSLAYKILRPTKDCQGVAFVVDVGVAESLSISSRTILRTCSFSAILYDTDNNNKLLTVLSTNLKTADQS